jgi:glyoxylase-like metal-dependent hydrolase (beta-lactamase superfamily II)
MFNRKLLVFSGLLVLLVALATADALAQQGRDLQVNDQLVPVAYLQASSTPEPGTVEVLKYDADDKAILARVYLPFNVSMGIPLNIPINTAIWSYLIRGSEGVVVIDPGVKCESLSLDYSCDGDSLDAQYVIEAMEEHFPDQRISEIAFTHWHVDHAQNGPRLQQMAFDEWEFRPPLRIHPEDKADADEMYQDTGYADGSWDWGEDLIEGSTLTGTTFQVLHLPGHTFGLVGFVSQDWEMGIADPSVFTSDDLFMTLVGQFLGLGNEDPDSMEESRQKWYEAVDEKGYTSYSVHYPLFDEDACSIETALEGEPEKYDMLSALREVRDKSLATSPVGRRYIRRYYKHSPEISRLLLSDPELRARTAKLVKELMPAVRSLSDGAAGQPSPGGKMVLTKGTVREIEALLDDFAEKASPELRAVIWEVKGQLRSFEGKTLREIRLLTLTDEAK